MVDGLKKAAELLTRGAQCARSRAFKRQREEKLVEAGVELILARAFERYAEWMLQLAQQGDTGRWTYREGEWSRSRPAPDGHQGEGDHERTGKSDDPPG